MEATTSEIKNIAKINHAECDIFDEERLKKISSALKELDTLMKV